MTKKLIIYFTLVLISLLGTAFFMCYHHALFAPYSGIDWLQVLWHSLPHHLTVAGYVMALPLLLEVVSIWCPGAWHRHFMAIYLSIISVPLVVGWAVNLVLYGFWGICLDSTVLIYLQDNPKDALAESPLWAIILLIVLLVLVVVGVYRVISWLYAPSIRVRRIHPCAVGPQVKHKALLTLAALLLCGLDFVAIRGGVTPSTQNPGRAYFSTEMPLNHAAVNPVFNFLYSLGKNKDFGSQYRFMSAEEATQAIEELNQITSHQASIMSGTTPFSEDSLSSTPHATLLNTSSPNILLILFESFSGAACHALESDADPQWMPSVNRMYEEGLGFSRFYANSFRTDRGVASVLASYPGQPTNSIMKDQSKCDNLQYLSKRLTENGYELQFVHGGDVNFTNMKGFLRAGGFTDIVGDTHFPLTERLSKWGVPDHLMFNYLYEQLHTQTHKSQTSQTPQSLQTPPSSPFFKVFLTLSSHEPFDVPYHHYDDEYINSIAYADSCFGAFVDRVKADTLLWQNLLIIGMPDHCFAQFPVGVQQHDPLRYHIPMFWTGGALSLPHDSLGHAIHLTDVIGQQTDLAATLLGQLNITHDDFNFSKDLFDPQAPHFAFYSFSDGFGLITDGCQYVQDNMNDGVGLQPGTYDPEGKAQRWGKAYLQQLYDDLSAR